MGKQILLHMASDDTLEFCAFARQELGLQWGRRDGETESVSPVTCESITSDATFCVWSMALCPDLIRSWIPDPGYFRIDTLRLPVMEYLPSVTAEWKGVPALCQGRIFGNFEANLGKPVQFLEAYEAILQWIKSGYRKNPFRRGGYIGPSAWEFYEKGGYLLPSYVPPETPEWNATLLMQHPRS